MLNALALLFYRTKNISLYEVKDMINEKLENGFIEGLKGLMIGTWIMIKSLLKTYAALLMILLMWPIMLVNWIRNKKRAYC